MTSDPQLNPKMPRVLIAGHLPPPMSGIGTYYQTLLSSSLPRQVNLQFIDTSLRRRSGCETGKWSFSNLVSALGDCTRYTRAVILYRPNICHIATAYGLSFIKHSLCVVIARLLGSKVLLHPHCSFDFLYEQQSKTWQWFFRKVIALCEGVVILSNEWSKLKEVAPDCNIYYLPNAINLAGYLDVGREKIESKSNLSYLHILYLGYIGRAKGSFDLISAAKIVLERDQGVIFDLVGQEQILGDIKQLNTNIVEAGLEQFVYIHPAVDGVAKLRIFRSADIFVYPSYHEGMPMAVIEAMACGLPIIATQVGGLPDLVCPGLNGLLVPAGQPDQLAEAIHKLVIDPDVRALMQANNLRLAREKYDIENLVGQLVEIYIAISSSRKRELNSEQTKLRVKSK